MFCVSLTHFVITIKLIVWKKTYKLTLSRKKAYKIKSRFIQEIGCKLYYFYGFVIARHALSIVLPPLCFLRRASFVVLPLSCFLRHASSVVLYPSYFVLRASSFMLRPSFFVRRISSIVLRQSCFLRRALSIVLRSSCFVQRASFIVLPPFTLSLNGFSPGTIWWNTKWFLGVRIKMH